MTSPSATAASASRRVLERRARGSIAWWGGSSSAEKRNLFWSAPNCAQLPSIGAIFCLGPAGPSGFRGSQVELDQVVVANRNDHGHPHAGRGVTPCPSSIPTSRWRGFSGGGFVAILAGSAYLWVIMTLRARRRPSRDQPAQAENAGLRHAGR
jgi:hypothetical protein